MNHRLGQPFALALSVFLFCTSSPAAMPTNPVDDAQFLLLPSGISLSSVQVSGQNLSLTHGTNEAFTPAVQAAYQQLKTASQRSVDHPVQWMLMDLDSRQVLAQSARPDKRIFGASVAKVFVAATLLDQQQGALKASQLQLMSDMIVVSSNTAWMELQSQIGHGNEDKGREANYNFTQKMGYHQTRGFQGQWGQLHGNELCANELVDFLYDTYHGRYPGAEVLWKVMHTGRTGSGRAKKYIPKEIIVGGKTGTYDGPSIDPETGRSTGPDGRAYSVQVRHQIVTFHIKGRQYGLAILANDGSDSSAALLAGGLLREYTGYSAAQ